MEAFIWIGSVLLVVLGLAGTLIPALPGAPLVLAGALLHKLLLPAYLSWWTVGGLAVLTLMSLLLDLAATAGAAKRLGASRWGMVGAAVGSLIGLFGGLMGVLVGAVAGAALGESLLAGRPPAEAGRAALGAGLGLLVSAAGRAVLAAFMALLFVLDCLI